MIIYTMRKINVIFGGIIMNKEIIVLSKISFVVNYEVSLHVVRVVIDRAHTIHFGIYHFPYHLEKVNVRYKIA
jgi:hypothetical protein